MANQAVFEDLAESIQLKLKTNGRQFANFDGVDYYYQDGYWRVGTFAQMERLKTTISRLANNRGVEYSAKMAQIIETLRRRFGSEDEVTFDPAPRLACRNGTVDLLTSELLEHSPDHMCTRYADIEFDPDADCREWKAMLERIFQGYEPEEAKRYIDMMQEFYGVSIVGDNMVKGTRDLRRAMLIYGPAGSGKTALSETLATLLGGEEHVVSNNLDQLGRDFGLENFLGARAYIADDGVDMKTKVDTKMLKRLVTGEQITVNRKFMSAVSFRFHGPIVFTSNELPDFTDQSDGTYKRIITVETKHVFTAAEKKKLGKVQNVQEFLKKKKEFAGILNWALEGYDRIVSRVRAEGKGFVVPPSSKDLETVMREKNDPVYDFLRNHCAPDAKCSNDARNVSLAAGEYALVTHNKRVTRPAALQDVVRRIKEVHPETNVERAVIEGLPVTILGGLRIKESGAYYLKSLGERDFNAQAAYQTLNARR